MYLPPFGPLGDPADLVELAVSAEAAGWDGVFLWDHVVAERPPIVDSWTVLGAIAHATERVSIGPMVTPLPRRRPWVVARQASTVSRLSRGRLVVGLGLGSDESGDFGRFGDETSVRGRAAMLDDGLDVLRAVWSGRAHQHEGPRYRVDLPHAPAEPHRIPIRVASSTGHPGVIRRAAACDGIFPNPDDHVLTPEEVAGVVTALGAARRRLPGADDAAAGRAVDVAVRGNAGPARDEPSTVDLGGLAEAGMTWWMESLFWLDPLELSLTVVDAGPPRVPDGASRD